MVRILCEGKTDKTFILGLLSHFGIEDREGDFEIMGCKNNFFDFQRYKMIIQLVNIAVPVCIKYNFRGNVESSFVHLKE